MTPPLIARRTLLGGALATLVLGTACSNACGPPTAANPATMSALREQKPFYVAHRGGGGNWPEMTLYAYQQAAKVPGLRALEVSVCSELRRGAGLQPRPRHKRVSGVDYTIADQPWSMLSHGDGVRRGDHDPSQPARPLSRYDEVAAEFQDGFVFSSSPRWSGAYNHC